MSAKFEMGLAFGSSAVLPLKHPSSRRDELIRRIALEKHSLQSLRRRTVVSSCKQS
jgi:hypothetical protein